MVLLSICTADVLCCLGSTIVDSVILSVLGCIVGWFRVEYGLHDFSLCCICIVQYSILHSLLLVTRALLQNMIVFHGGALNTGFLPAAKAHF